MLFALEPGIRVRFFLQTRKERNKKNSWLIIFCVLRRILAPTMYVFFASALPVIAFGEQLSKETGLLQNSFLCSGDEQYNFCAISWTSSWRFQREP